MKKRLTVYNDKVRFNQYDDLLDDIKNDSLLYYVLWGIVACAILLCAFIGYIVYFVW